MVFSLQVIREEPEPAGKPQQRKDRHRPNPHVNPAGAPAPAGSHDRLPDIGGGRGRFHRRQRRAQHLLETGVVVHGWIPWRASSSLNIRTARKTRDLTVPTGTSRASAISEYGRSSTIASVATTRRPGGSAAKAR